MLGYEDTTEDGLLARTDPFDKAAATLLGLALFAYARLDLHLGLCLAAATGRRASELVTMPLAEKLQRIEPLVDAMPPGSARDAYRDWIGRCRASRLIVGDLVAGRWVPDARSGVAVNLVVLPTGQEARAVYPLAELEETVELMAELLTCLNRLRREALPGLVTS